MKTWPDISFMGIISVTTGGASVSLIDKQNAALHKMFQGKPVFALKWVSFVAISWGILSLSIILTLPCLLVYYAIELHFSFQK